MTTMHHPSPQPAGLTSFAIYEDPQDREPMSPSDMYEEGDSFHSERSFPNQVVHSIELQQQQQSHEPDDEPQPYRSSYTSRPPSQPPMPSHYSFVSAIPSEPSISSKPILAANEAGARARKERPRFRNTESVRAMHMSSPPPMLAHQSSHERLKGSYKLTTPSRNGGAETPGSRKSGSRRRSIREPHSPRPTPTPQQAPLVLLHVTILPMQLPYSHDIMARIMPAWLVENYKLLEEKLQDIILMRRGLLIPHPRDEYDLLEERILESLELKTPRILPCGHFVAPDDDDDDDDDDEDREDADDTASLGDENTGRGSRMSGGTLTEGSNTSANGDHSMCIDCHRQLKKPGKGIGAGTRKWDIKIYAANGLMRAAAWGACWNDMERCDVEIHPWVPEQVRKTLEKKAREEHEADKRKHQYTIELQRQIQEAAAKTKMLEDETNEKKRQEEAELQKSFDEAAAALQKSIQEKAAEKKKFEEDLAAKLHETKEAVRLEMEARALAESDAVADRFRALEHALKEKEEAETALRPRSPSDVPLSILVKNYLVVLAGDKRNLVILLLGAAVVYLAMSMHAVQQQASTAQMLQLPTDVVAADSMPMAVTATMTATSYSTLTVTESQNAVSRQEETAVAAAPVQAIADPDINGPVPVDEIVLEPEDALPTSRAVQVVVVDSTVDVVPVADLKTEALSAQTAEAVVAEDMSNTGLSATEVDATSCPLEPVLFPSPPLSYCAASKV